MAGDDSSAGAKAGGGGAPASGGPGGGSAGGGAPSLDQILASRWDPGKLSTFMRSSEQSKGQRLDLSTRGRFETRLGVDLGDVRIFSGELAEQITRAHNAEALTIGDTGMILMGRSATFAPGTAAGTALLAHELTHVAQARPSAIARKKVESDLAEEDESEEEAERHEAEVHAEELGLEAAKPSEAEKKEEDDERKERIKAKVIALFRENLMGSFLRNGVGPRLD